MSVASALHASALPPRASKRPDDAPRLQKIIQEGNVDALFERMWLASIVDSTDDAIISKNLDGIITSWNKSAQWLFGYPAEEVIGKSVTIIIPPERHHEEDMILGHIRRGERIEHYENVSRRKDGSVIDVSLAVSPIRGVEGKVLGTSKIARDVTRKNAPKSCCGREVKKPERSRISRLSIARMGFR